MAAQKKSAKIGLDHSEPKSGVSIQNVSGRNKRPSKYKLIEPTKLVDLVNHQPKKYHIIEEDVLNNLTQHEMVKIVFINREDLWINVNSVDHEDDTVNGSIATKCTKLEGLQIGQLVSFKKEHIVEVHEDSGSDSY